MPSNVSFKVVPYPSAVPLARPYPLNTAFPVSLTPSSSSTNLPDLLNAIAKLVSTGQIRKLLNEHGAIYFEGVNLATRDDFSRFARAFGFVPYVDVGNFASIHQWATSAATENGGTSSRVIYAHHEFGSDHHHPAYVFLYCASAPHTGGETAINNSIVLYHQLKEKHPEFIQQLERRGVKYQSTYTMNSQHTTPSLSSTMLKAFGQQVHSNDTTESIRAKIEKELKRHPTLTYEWINQTPTNPLGDLRCLQTLPAIRPHPRTGQPAFFNNIVSHFLYALDAGTLDPPHVDRDGQYRPPAFYGDGGGIPREYFESATEIVRQTRALVKWRKGDVLLLDNHAVQHGAEAWTGNRELVVSLWDLEDG